MNYPVLFVAGIVATGLSLLWYPGKDLFDKILVTLLFWGGLIAALVGGVGSLIQVTAQ